MITIFFLKARDKDEPEKNQRITLKIFMRSQRLSYFIKES